ncbi:MAG: rhomboid family intramembrane serine protease [Gemmataceae bacterium]
MIMLLMGTNDEIVSHMGENGAPTPEGAGEATQPQSPPTPDLVLRWIAAAGDQPWFPSRHAAETQTDRDALDAPLAQLRVAELVRVATWVRGVGQGYVLTPEGAARVAQDAKPPTGGVVATASVEPASSEARATVPTPEEQAIQHFGLNTRRRLIVPIILLVNVCWFCVGAVIAVRGGHSFSEYLSTKPPLEVLHRIGAVSGNDLLHGDWWRLLSSCFVHIGLVHLLANMFALAMLGPLAEILWGRLRLGVIYGVSGLAGSCLAMSNHPDALLAGASGAIWGILTSLLAWLMLFRSDLPDDAAVEWARRLWLAFLLNAAVSFLPGVSWEAHLGGGAAGFVASGLLNALRFASGPRQLLALVLLLAMPVACLGGLVAAMKWGEAWAEARGNPFTGEEYNRDVVPRLERISPGAVEEVQKRAWAMLFKPKAARNQQVEAETRAELAELRNTADETAALLARHSGVSRSLEATRQKAKEYAEAQSRELSLLIAMLDLPTPPDQAAWATWGDARRAAVTAWEHVRQK